MTNEPQPPHWQGHRERLHTKLLARGAGALDDYESLDVRPMAFIPRRDVKPIAKALQATFKILSAALAAPTSELVKVEGVGETVAAYRKAILELNARAAREEIQTREAISLWTALVEDVRREIARRALEIQCCSLILVHNRPSGDPKPSRADINITCEIINVLQPFDITVHDHLIVGTAGVVSFRSFGLL